MPRNSYPLGTVPSQARNSSKLNKKHVTDQSTHVCDGALCRQIKVFQTQCRIRRVHHEYSRHIFIHLSGTHNEQGQVAVERLHQDIVPPAKNSLVMLKN